MMMAALILIAALILAVLLFVRQPPFGKPPLGARLDRIRRSPNFRNGAFQNLSPTPNLTEGVGYPEVLRNFLFKRNRRSRPVDRLPTGKTDLLSLRPEQDVLVWFGHSSYFLQIDGKRMAVDPALSGAASPLSFTNRSFPGTDVYTPDDLPDLDYLFISHDHWDHLDYATVKKLAPKTGRVITGLGTGAHLESWGFDPGRILECDWNERAISEDGFTVDVLPARHFSGRGFRRNRALWVSFVLKTPTRTIYLGGDSGYDAHFREIGDRYGPFDLAILECGQYDRSWKYIHMTPEEAVRAALDLRARRLLPVHWGKFVMANHDWDEPLLRVTAASREAGMPLLTPLIGEAVDLKNAEDFTSGWESSMVRSDRR
jgi:L-ascorbate metabolism protein UlaG (beta-lactamase superfamily)